MPPRRNKKKKIICLVCSEIWVCTETWFYFGVRQCLVGLLEQTNDDRPQMDIMDFM